MPISEFMIFNTLCEYVIRSPSERDVILCPVLQCAQEWSAKVVKEMENTNQINDSNPILLWLCLCTSRFPQATVELSKVFLTVLGSASFFQLHSYSGGSCSQSQLCFF